MTSTGLSLGEALAGGRLAEFVNQCKAEGAGPADRTQFGKMLERIIARLPEGQTSHLPAGDYSPET